MMSQLFFRGDNGHARASDDDRRQCICCYYGALSALPLILSVFALIFSWAYTFSCHFYRATEEGYPYDLGLWQFERFNESDLQIFLETGEPVSFGTGEKECDTLVDHGYLQLADVDAAFKLARVLSLLVILLGSLVLSCLFVMTCAKLKRSDLENFTCLLGTFGVMSLLVLSSKATDFCEESCSLQGAGILCIVAAFVWFGAAASMCIFPWQRNDGRALGGRTNNPAGALELTQMPVTLPAAGPVVLGAARSSGELPLTTMHTIDQQQADGTWVQVTTQVTETPTPAGTHTVTVVNSIPLAAAAAASSSTPIATAVPILAEHEYSKKG